MYHVSLGIGFSRKGTLMFAVCPTLTVTVCAASGSRTDHRLLADLQGGAAGRHAQLGWGRSPRGWGRGHGVTEGLGVGGRARRGLALSTAGGDLTCDKHRDFPLCTLGPGGVFALEVGPHTEEAELVYRTLLQDPHARICRGEG